MKRLLSLIVLSAALLGCSDKERKATAETRVREAARLQAEAKEKAARPDASVADGVDYDRTHNVTEHAIEEAKRAGVEDPVRIAAEEYARMDAELDRAENEKHAALKETEDRFRALQADIQAKQREAENASKLRAMEDQARLARAKIRAEFALQLGTGPHQPEPASRPRPSTDPSLPAGVEPAGNALAEPLVIDQ